MNAPRPAILSFLRSLIVSTGSIGAVVSVQAAPVVSNLTSAQRAGTKLVDITYDLEAPGLGVGGGDPRDLERWRATWTVPVASATGAVGGSVAPGTGKAIVWNAGVDWLGNYSTQMRFRVVADYGFALIPGGSFTMGVTSGDTDTNAPSVTVTASPFYIHKTETTKAQWDEVKMRRGEQRLLRLGSGAGKVPSHPVHSVSLWNPQQQT